MRNVKIAKTIAHTKYSGWLEKLSKKVVSSEGNSVPKNVKLTIPVRYFNLSIHQKCLRIA